MAVKADGDGWSRPPSTTAGRGRPRGRVRPLPRLISPSWRSYQ